MILRTRVPRALKPLLYPARYKGAHGGRGSGKSHFFAEQLIARCATGLTRAVGIREIQKSIRDSVRQLLADKIAELQVGHLFEVLDNEIRGRNGSLIIFRGMQTYNAETIKSLEGFDVAWVEEAQTLSDHSWKLLRPTIRKEQSEIWCSWNPRYKTDCVDAFFRRNPPRDAVSVQCNWRDNPWFPEVLRKEMEHDFQVDEEEAMHIWEGAYGAARGAILAKWVTRAERANRVHADVAFDPQGHPLEISSDLGFRDTASWWFWQRKPKGFSLLRYDGDQGLDADDWIPRLQMSIGQLGAPLGKIWLPHDARAKTFQSKHSSVERFITAFGADKIGIVAQSKKADQISAARAIIERCEFHKDECEAGLDGLRAWQFDFDEDLGVFSKEPLHDWASHPSDAFAYGCQVMQEDEPKPAPVDTTIRGITVGANTVTLDELWRDLENSKSKYRKI